MRRTLLDNTRRGAITPLTAILMIALCAMVAFAVDTGYIAVVRSEAQNAADTASLAGTAKLAEQLKIAPISKGIPVQTANDLKLARDEAKAFAANIKVGSVSADVQDSDIEIGYMANPYDHSTSTLDTSGWPARPYNAVRVTVRRDKDHAGGSLSLFFAPIIGIKQSDVQASATAAFVMGTVKPKGNQEDYSGGLLPFAYQVDQWKALLAASSAGTVTAANGATVTLTDDFSVESNSTSSNGVGGDADSKLETSMYPDNTTSGNYGTINFTKSKSGNSTNVLRDLIENGPAEADWPDLGDIVEATTASPVSVNGDPGLSSGMKSAVEAVIGQSRILPLYSTVSGNGNNTYYQIVGFTPVTIVASNFGGSKKSFITIQPRVIAQHSLIDGTDRIEFDITPSATPDPLYIGPAGLVR